TGLICTRVSRVRQAGIVFFAVGALMVPLNFVGAYAFFFSDDDIDPTGLWLAGSLASALFYAAVSLLGIGRWYAVPLIAALHSALAAALVLAGAPPEAYPGSFIALNLLLTAPSIVAMGRVSDAFGRIGLWTAHAFVPLALIAALAIAGASDSEEFVSTRWFLPPTAAIATVFYVVQALWSRRAYPSLEPYLSFAALAVAGGAAVTLVYALDVGQQWYGPAVAIVGWLYAAGSERFAPDWPGRRHTQWLALGSITVSWLLFEAIYGDFSRIGAGVHFSAAAFYLGAARLVQGNLSTFELRLTGDRDGRAEDYRLPLAAPFLYAAGLVSGIGFYHLLVSLPAAETADASDLAIAFFGASLGVAAIAATMRWWWPQMRLHMYAIAAGTSLFVLLAAVDNEGQVALLLTVYAAVALALTLWEMEPLALSMPGVYGFFAILAAWRFYEPNDAYLPLTYSAIATGLFAFYAAFRRQMPAWTDVALALAFLFAVVAPLAGWIRLSSLADPQGLVGSISFEETALYQTSAAAVAIVGLLLLAQAWLVRRIEFAAGASALLMVALLLEIGHFRPENVQAYTAPLGVYLLAAGILASRVRELPEEIETFIEPLQALGAAVIMGPSLVQSWQPGGWPYALILLGEGLAFLGLALVQRQLWLLGTAMGFVVLEAFRYLFEGGRALPDWVTLTLAGLVLLAAGTAILLGRDTWLQWQASAQQWWRREPLPSRPRIS
ncbi:MAG: hypothetical protein IH958_00635, partial [Chloroflexi bacterium]|nr:hypothetical protein [Chloroflexota bacterium]